MSSVLKNLLHLHVFIKLRANFAQNLKNFDADLVYLFTFVMFASLVPTYVKFFFGKLIIESSFRYCSY